VPIYEYKCSECGYEMDHFHRSRKEPKPPCKACGEDSLERLISLTSFQLKGNGWYVTDYRGAGQPPVPAPPKSVESSANAEAKSSSEPKDSASAADTAKSAEGGKHSSTKSKSSPDGKNASEDKKKSKDKVAA